MASFTHSLSPETVAPVGSVLTASSSRPNASLPVSATAQLYTDLVALCWYVFPPVLLASGTFGNVMTVIVMRGMARSPATASLYFFFMALAVSDQCVLTTSMIFYWIDIGFSWPPSFFRYNLLCALPKFVWNACGVISTWLLVVMTFQRVTSVVMPHRVGIVCTVRRGKIIVGIITIIACAMHAEYLFTWVYWPEHGKCQYQRRYLHLGVIFEWMELVCTSLLSFVGLVVGNAVLVWHVLKSRQVSAQLRGGADSQAKSAGSLKVSSMTTTLIVTSVVFLVLSLPDDILDVSLQASYLDIADPEVKALVKLGGTLATMMSISGYVYNFYLYVLSGRRFRQETARYLCCAKKAAVMELSSASAPR